MSLTRFSSDFLIESFTLVDNLFISEHLPYYDEKLIKVYIYGLYLCTLPQNDNTLEKMAEKLNCTTSEIISAYEYYDDMGLCRMVSKEPLQVLYLSLKRDMQPPKKYRSNKWSGFNKQLQSLYPERPIMPNEYNEYYSFIENSRVTPDAMLMIVQYCINQKGAGVGYPYILTVARNWAADGVRTTDDVERRLEEYDAQSETMRAVLEALGRKSGAQLEEKQALIKWTRSWGFELEAILAAAKSLKSKKTFARLDNLLDEFYRMSVFTPEEISDYTKRREQLRSLAIDINKTIGVYYESVDHIIEVYITPWMNYGFDDKSLKTIAHFCFISGIRTLDGMNSTVNKFFAQGLLTVGAIDEFIRAQSEQDKKIRKLIETCGRSRAVTASDRQHYAVWSAGWGFSDDIILYAAERAADKTYFIPFINQLLASWKAEGIKTLEEAKKRQPQSVPPAATKQTKKFAKNFTERNYTEEEMKSVMVTIDQLDDIDL